MSQKESKVGKFIQAPIRVLSKARDFYVKNMLRCAGDQFTYASAMSCPAPQAASLPRSFSVNSSVSSSDEDFRELIRTSSIRSLTGKIEAEIFRSKQSPGLKVVPRSQTVTIGRIDEDKPCEFVEDVVVNPNLYPRSKSYAPSSRSKIL